MNCWTRMVARIYKCITLFFVLMKNGRQSKILESGRSVWIVKKTFVSWFLVVWGLNSKQNWKLSLQLIQGTHRNQTKLFIGSRTCIWCCYFVCVDRTCVRYFFLCFFFSFQLSIGLFYFTFFLFSLFLCFVGFASEFSGKKLFTHASKHTRTHTKKGFFPFYNRSIRALSAFVQSS